ncbi:MAG: hypothetical protein M1822_008670 [Bathelium mastoideum]|nr:MAG: hypothetical protein M1822_008670 [Bathelium mastoideum]
MDNEGLNLNDRIHDFENAKSASNIDFPQYLLLRVLYQEPKPASTLPEPDNQDYWFGKDNVDKASGVLKSLSSWIEYVKYSKSAWSSNQQPICPIPESIGSFLHTLVGFSTESNCTGTFSLVYYYQQLVHRDIDAETRYSAPKLDFTPIAKRTRLATTAAASRVVLPATPTPSSRNAQSTWPGAAEDYDSIIDGLEQLDSGFSDTPQSSLQAISPMSSAPEDQATYNRAVEDEQIVNTCLLLFLHAISVHVQVQGLGSKWTLHRRSFRVQSGPEKVFEARVDGYLLMSDGTAGAVIEVKPFLRTRQGDAIRMQEAAQLAAWICDQPPREKLATGRKYT